MAKVNLGDIEPNSAAYKNQKKKEKERERLSPVVKKDSIVRAKASPVKKFTEKFFGKDTDELKTWVVWDVVVPGIQDLLLNGLSMAFRGEPLRRGSSSGRREPYPYHSAYSSSRRSSGRRESYRREDEYGGKLDYRDVVLKNREDAEDIIDQMRERIEKEGEVTVAEFFDMLDSPSDMVDNDWGWTSVRDIGLRRVSDGWKIDVARARALD